MSIKRLFRWPYIIPMIIILGPIGAAAVVFVFGGIVMLLWNWLLPPLVGLPTITLLQAFGLLVLCRMLFGGFGGGGGGHPAKQMSPEERERFRRRMNERFCGRSDVPGNPAGTDDEAGSSSPLIRRD